MAFVAASYLVKGACSAASSGVARCLVGVAGTVRLGSQLHVYQCTDREITLKEESYLAETSESADRTVGSTSAE